MTDSELSELGKLKFNEQFNVVEDIDVMVREAADSDGSDVFGGLSREAFLVAHVHRRLHSDAERLTDVQIAEVGRLSFTEQFPEVQKLCLEVERFSVVSNVKNICSRRYTGSCMVKPKR